jgi:S-DNA-T family DNA segregation ATPase FtsK/SpoIIIE
MRAKTIPCIPTILTEDSIKWDFKAMPDGYKLPIGLTYSEVEPFYLDISKLGLMGLCGKENTGHKNFVHYILSSFESSKEQYPVRVVIFDDVTRKFECLKNSPIVDTYTLDVERVVDTIQEWHTILNERYNSLVEEGTIGKSNELLLMIVQNNDIAKKIGDDFDLMEQFNEIISRFKGMNVAIIFSNYQNASLSYDAPEPLRIIKQEQHIVFFEDLDNLKTFDVPYEEIKANRKRLETGDAYYIQDNMVTKLKIVKAKSADM